MRRLLIACGVALTLAGCGQGGEGGDQFPVKIAPEIHDDGTAVLRKGNGAEPGTLDPHKAQGVPAANILRDLYEGLVSKAPDGSLEPGAAKSWEISDDRRTYTFKLRDDAVWSNGEPVTAAHFAYSLRRTVDPATGSVYASILAPIENAAPIVAGDSDPSTLGVEAVDDTTLRVRLKAPTPYFLGLLTHSTSYPVYPPAVEEHGDAFTRPGNSVTNGAYTLSDWVVSSRIVLSARDNYWDADNVGVGRVEYYPIEDTASELKRYQAGELDWTASIPIPELDTVREQIPDQYNSHPSLGNYYYGLNVTKPPFKDAPELRKALSMAIDREVIVEKITRGGETPAYGWVPPVVSDYEGARLEYADWSPERRHEEARKLYQAAGYSEDNPLEVEIRYNTNDSHKKIASVVASMWKRNLGVDVSLINEEWKVFLQNVQAKDVTEAFRAGWIGDYNDPYTFLELMHSDFGINGAGYANEEYDALLERAAQMPGGDKRRSLLREAEAILLADHPVIPIYFYNSKSLIKPYVEGYEGNPMGHYYSKDIRIVPGSGN